MQGIGIFEPGFAAHTPFAKATAGRQRQELINDNYFSPQ